MMTAEKIVDISEAQSICQAWKAQGKEVVFTNGCFDILHMGHVEYLEKARALGDRMILGLNTDASIKRLKGETRPVVPEQARARVMAALQFIDLVVLFDEDTPLEIIKTLLPDTLVKGNDYSVDTIVGAKEVMERGGSVKTIELVDGFSTSSIIEKIKES